MTGVEEVEVVIAHRERATLRVGDVFLKVDGDAANLEAEVASMALAPVPTPEVLWCRPPVLALAALRGAPIACLGEPSTATPAQWAAAGAVVRRLHDAPLPSWTSRKFGSLDTKAAELEAECAWLVDHDVLPAESVARGRQLAEVALAPHDPVFVHGDLHVAHLFVEGDEVTGVLDWSEAGRGDGLFDLAVLTLGHPEHLADVLAGYGRDVDLDVVRGWWALRCLLAIRWLLEHGFDATGPGGEVDVLRRLV